VWEVEFVNIALATLVADTWMHGDWGWGWMSLMMVLMVLFWGGIIVGVVWLVRSAGGAAWTREGSMSRETPVEILDRRFAEGEISEEDYRARREVLAGRGGAAGTT
jgi:putative membrane protein